MFKVVAKDIKGFRFNPNVKEYALKPVKKSTGEGEDDFIVTKVPYVVDSYNHDKVIQARTKGCDCKAYCQRIINGEVLPVGQSSYGDFTNQPKNLTEALERKVETERIIDKAHLENLSKSDLKELGELSKGGSKAINELAKQIAEQIKNNNGGAGAKVDSPVANDVKKEVVK